MSKKIITLGAAALTSLTLSGVIQSTSVLADSIDQGQISLQKNSNSNVISKQVAVNIPDANLRKALNRTIDKGRIEGHAISKEELKTIKSLDLREQGISSLEGLQYCSNLHDIDFSTDPSEFSTGVHNTISDLSPLKNLPNLEIIDFKGMPIVDFRPLKNMPLDWLMCAGNLVSSYNVKATTNPDGSLTVKNPFIGFNGEPIIPNDLIDGGLKGGVYNKENNTITWSHDEFYKHIEHFYKHALLLNTMVDGSKENQSIPINFLIEDESTEGNADTGQEHLEQVINIGGQAVGGYSDHSHDSGFARVSLKFKDHKVSIIKGSDYQFHWSGWKNSKYASIKLTDPKGTVLYDQSWKGNESVNGNGYQKFGTFAQYDLPEGSTVEVYHAEGPWHRFSTNNDAELKSKLGQSGYTYTYQIQNNQLVLQNVDENADRDKKEVEQEKNNLFKNSEFKLIQKENKYTIPNWSVATVEAGLSGLSSLKDTFMNKEPRHIIGQFAYTFEDGSDLYRVGNNPRDFIGVNEKTHKATIATAANGVTSTCFSQTVDTKPGQKYHLSLDIEPNQVTKSQLGGSTATSEFSEKNFLIACQNEDGSHLVNLNAHLMKKEGNTYSIDIPAKSNKTKFYVLLGTPNGLKGFYSAQISNLSLTEIN